MIHQHLPGPRTLDDAASTEYHVAHHSGVGQAKQHDIGRRTKLGGAPHLPRTRLDEGGAFVR